MAKYKKKFYYKKKVLKAIFRYSRKKIGYACAAVFGENGPRVDENTVLNLNDIISKNTSDFQIYGKEYALVKLRGVAIEAILDDHNSAAYNFLLSVQQANEPIDFYSMRNQANYMLLPKTGKARMYVRLNSEFEPTNLSNVFSNIIIAISNEGTIGSGRSTRFSLKITLYCTFKTKL